MCGINNSLKEAIVFKHLLLGGSSRSGAGEFEDGSGDDDQSDVDANGSDKDEPADAEDDFLDSTPEEQDEHFDDKLLHSAGGPWDQQDEENFSPESGAEAEAQAEAAASEAEAASLLHCSCRPCCSATRFASTAIPPRLPGAPRLSASPRLSLREVQARIQRSASPCRSRSRSLFNIITN